MDESRSDPSQTATPEPYGLGRMLEDTACALFRAGDVFDELSGRPAPSYAVMIPNLLVFCAAVCVENLLHASIAAPELLHASPAAMTIAAAAGLILAVPLSFVAAGVLHAFMLLSGGEGDFRRSYQASSMFSILIALQALLNWFDWVWALPALLAAYLGAAAARTLHRAPALRAGAVFCLVAAFCIAGQWWLRDQLSRWSQTARAIQTAATTVQDLSHQLQQLQQMSMPAEPGGSGAGRGMPEAPGLRTGAGLAALQNSPTPTGLSSLELLSPPQGGNQPVSPAAQVQAQAQAQVQSVQEATTNLLGPIMAMLKSPAMTRGMSPEQVKQMGTATDMLAQMQKSMASGKKTTPEEQAAMITQFQSTIMQFMAQIPSPMSRQGLPDPGQKTAKPGRTSLGHKHGAGSPPKSDTDNPAQAPAPLGSPEKTSE